MRCIDLFAGAGGFSEGAEAAGLDVVWAANHWPAAIAVHEANHPTAKHICQDLHQVDWTRVPAHDLMLASPCCQGFSPARGKDKPHHDDARATAWAVIDAAEVCRPRAIVVENVPWMARWVLFPIWCAALEALGYQLAAESLDASRFRVPQMRERLFLVALLSGRRFRFPPLPAWEPVPIRDALNLDAGGWRPWATPGRVYAGLRPLVPATLARIEEGLRSHGDRPFRVQYNGSARGGVSLDQPIGTITTRDRYALVQGDRFRFLAADECRAAMGFPAGYRLTGKHALDVHLLGNAVCPPVPAWLLTHVAEVA
jgi:DNA (cytosine-5)-methyltransferase 1